jgi:hypothetical protein
MPWLDHPATAWALAVLAFALAAAGARDQPGGFNDGSRLATAESLIERGTLAIDDSIFVRPLPPAELAARGLLPEDPNPVYSLANGTLDKLLIDGRYYSDKPMIPAVMNAAAYRALMVFGLPRPAERPDVFTRVSTILMCGLGYAVAVGCMWQLGKRVGLPPAWRLVWLAGFALATVLLAYTRQLNSGMPQLGATAGLALLLSYIAWPGRGLYDAPGAADRGFEDSAPVTRTRTWLLFGAGACAGFGFTIDQASGAPLLALAAIVVYLRRRRLGSTAIFLAGALPWAAAHLGVNYAIGGVLVPLNMVPQYFQWPGSPFNESNMTGMARHTPLGLMHYLSELLVGESGFLIFNLPLLLAVAVGWRVLVKPVPDRVELAALFAWSAIVVVVYAVLSDNFGGFALSIRWFVPLLVPGFWVLARLLVEWPTLRIDFVVLAAFGFIVSAKSWPCGPWLIEEQPQVLYLARIAVVVGIAIRVIVYLRSRWKRRVQAS